MTVSDMIVAESKEARQKNIILCQEAAKDPSKSHNKWLISKVNNYIERFAFEDECTAEDILSKIQEDRLFAASFAKDPGKQQIHEKIQLRELKKQLKEYSVEKQVSKGPNAVYIVDGKIFKGKPSNTTKQKSIDAIIDGYYCSLKFTHEGGGGQDNQKNDIISFLENAGDIKVAAITDGNYYKNPEIKEQLDNYSSKNIFVGTRDDFIEKISTGAI